MNRALSLSGVALGAAGVSASLAALCTGMRDVMVTNGGSCASGGPYAVAPGHECSTSATVLLTAAPFVGLALTALLVAASDAWSDDRISGVGAAAWGALFGALGWNFIDLGIHPPADMSGAGVWIACGALFWAMALGGLWYAGSSMKDYFTYSEAAGGPAPGMAPAPLVRAAVNLAPGAAQAPVSSTTLLFAPTEGGAVATAGSPWIWLLTVVGAATAGAAALVALL